MGQEKLYVFIKFTVKNFTIEQGLFLYVFLVVSFFFFNVNPAHLHIQSPKLQMNHASILLYYNTHIQNSSKFQSLILKDQNNQITFNTYTL